jgi:hypothetical protein
MQNVNFGQIHDLVVENAEPVLQPPPRITREHKFRGENGPRSERSARDFQLKSQVVELFAVFDTIQNATIGVLEVRHGLPFRMIITEDPGKPAA